MTIDSIKVELTQQILMLDDKELLDEIKWVLSKHKIEDKYLTTSIKEGIKQARKGEGIPHSEVKEMYQKWL